MENPALVGHQDLIALTGYQQSGLIERWCQERGVAYFRGRAGTLSTTVAALNQALGIDQTGPRPAAKLTF